MQLTKEQQIIGSVIEKAWEDPAFKAELIANPMEAIKKATGQTIDIPGNGQLIVHDQSNPNNAYLNIPVEPNMDDVELTDEQLELVAGGVDGILSILTPVICTGTPPYIPPNPMPDPWEEPNI